MPWLKVSSRRLGELHGAQELASPRRYTRQCLSKEEVMKLSTNWQQEFLAFSMCLVACCSHLIVSSSLLAAPWYWPLVLQQQMEASEQLDLKDRETWTTYTMLMSRLAPIYSTRVSIARMAELRMSLSREAKLVETAFTVRARTGCSSSPSELMMCWKVTKAWWLTLLFMSIIRSLRTSNIYKVVVLLTT